MPSPDPLIGASGRQITSEPDVLPGDVVALTFTASESHGFEFSHVSGGLVLSRLGDSDVTIDDKRGRLLRW